MKTEAGFSLLELTVAITLTGVVALLVYGTAAIASDTHARLLRHDDYLRSDRVWQVVVEDALRNVLPNGTGGTAALILEDDIDALGRPGDRLQFLTSGGTPPLTSDADWLVTLESRNGQTVMSWSPIGIATTSRREIRILGVGFDVRVFGGSPVATWHTAWNDRLTIPRAVEMTFGSDELSSPRTVLVNLAAGQLP